MLRVCAEDLHLLN